MDDHLRDLNKARLPDVRPGLSGVGGLVDTVAHGDVAARTARAGADVDHVGVRRGDLDIADRGDVEKVVRYVVPADARIGRLPNAATAVAGEVGQWVTRNAGDRGRSAAAGKARGAILQALEVLGIERDVRVLRLSILRLGLLRRDRAGDENDQGHDECDVDSDLLASAHHEPPEGWRPARRRLFRRWRKPTSRSALSVGIYNFWSLDAPDRHLTSASHARHRARHLPADPPAR